MVGEILIISALLLPSLRSGGLKNKKFQHFWKFLWKEKIMFWKLILEPLYHFLTAANRVIQCCRLKIWHIDNQPKMVLYVATFCISKMLLYVASYTNTHNMCKSTDSTFTNTHIQLCHLTFSNTHNMWQSIDRHWVLNQEEFWLCQNHKVFFPK